jgi:hypothetical protein
MVDVDWELETGLDVRPMWDTIGFRDGPRPLHMVLFIMYLVPRGPGRTEEKIH